MGSRFAPRAVLVCLATAGLLFSVATATGAADTEEQARRLLDATGVRGGLVVHLGCGDGRLTAALHAGDRSLVHGLTRDVATVEKARATIREKGLYGPVSVALFDGKHLPYIDNLVNLLVAEDLGDVPMGEVRRVLVPSGVAYVKGQDGWTKTVKPRPADIDEWTHWLHGPDNNAVSSDTRVGISRSLQWHMPPRWTRHHNLPAGFNALVAGGGRIYYMVDTAPRAVYGPGKWFLVARDAFNGLELWRRSIHDWNINAWGAEERYGGRIGRFHGAPDYQAPRRIVAAADRVFVTPGFHSPIVACDGATGEVVKTYGQTKNAGEFVVKDGVLYVARNVGTEKPSKEILAVDAHTGRTQWTNAHYTGIAADTMWQRKYPNTYITVGARHVFIADENDVVALDRATGLEAWKCRMPLTDETVGDIKYRYSNFCTIVYHEGRLFFCQIHPGTKNMNRWEMKKTAILALDAETGEKAWAQTGGTVAHVTPPDLFVTGGQVWTLDPGLSANGNLDARLLGIDCRSGQVASRFLLEKITHSHHHRCYRNKATERFYLMGEEGIEYVDFRSGESDVHYWLRGACRYGIMPANGFVYVPPHNCACYLGTLMHGFLALKREPTPAAGPDESSRLTKGPAYGATPRAEAASPAAWPMFRHDAGRSGAVPAELPDALTRQWEAAPGGSLTPPIVVGDRVYAASPDRCQVYGFDGTTGDLLWRFIADGPVTTPPAWHKGRLVFGTRAGSVYALTASDGRLMWRLRAAPSPRRLMAFGRLESPWPLDGSVLVMDGHVYCVAGRSMHLDGGLHVLKVDLGTGRIVQQTNLRANTRPKGEVEGSLLPDILVSDGEAVYMKSMRFDPADITKHELVGGSGRRGATKKPAHILRCATEMVDASGLNCCFWAYKGSQAQQLVFDDRAAFGTKGPHKTRWGGSFSHDVYRPGSGYALRKWTFRGKKAKQQWPKVSVPLAARAMALTANRLVLAGTPDKAPRDDVWAAYEGRLGGVLLVVSRDDAKPVARFDLDAPPVYNGLAATAEGLVLATADGRLIALGSGKAKEKP